MDGIKTFHFITENKTKTFHFVIENNIKKVLSLSHCESSCIGMWPGLSHGGGGDRPERVLIRVPPTFQCDLTMWSVELSAISYSTTPPSLSPPPGKHYQGYLVLLLLLALGQKVAPRLLLVALVKRVGMVMIPQLGYQACLCK